MSEHGEASTLQRRFLLALFAAGVLGTGAELLLLGHTEDRWQLVPLVVLGIGLLALTSLALWPRASSVRMFRYVMVLFVLSGLAGLYLHYGANAEFELEMYPSLAGLDLVREALTGAMPVFAPGMMTYLGLLGLASTFPHRKDCHDEL